MYGSSGPVWFTRPAHLDVAPGALFVCEIVDPEVVSRCSVLSCIAEAGGEAKLPDTVNMSEFRTWIMATKGNYNDHESMSFDTISTVLKVWLAQ